MLQNSTGLCFKNTFSEYGKTYIHNQFLGKSKQGKEKWTCSNQCTITLNGERSSFSTGKSVRPEDWEASKQRVKGTSETAKSINETLLQIRNKIYRKEAELMDRGYVAFEKLYKHFQQKGAYFVTRAKDNMSYEVIESRPVNKDSGVLSDETIRLAGYYSTRKYPDTLRLVVYEDFETGRVYRFLTNNFAIDNPLTIAELYRERWQIELFFKWIKQHLHIKTFYGTSKNAVYTQIWIAICDYLLLIIAKKRYGLDPSLHSISNSIGQVLFQRADIREIYNQPTTPVSVPEAGSVEQPTLW